MVRSLLHTLIFLFTASMVLPACTKRSEPVSPGAEAASPLPITFSNPRLFREYADTSGSESWFAIGWTTETLAETLTLEGRRALRVLEIFRGNDSTVAGGDTVTYAVDGGKDLWIYLAGAEGFLLNADPLGSLEVTGGFEPGWRPLLLQSAGSGESYSVLRASFGVKVQSDSLTGGAPVAFTVDLRGDGRVEGTELLERDGRLLPATKISVSLQLTLRSGFLIFPERPTLTINYWVAPNLGIVRRASLPLSLDLALLGGPVLRIPGSRRDLLLD